MTDEYADKIRQFLETLGRAWAERVYLEILMRWTELPTDKQPDAVDVYLEDGGFIAFEHPHLGERTPTTVHRMEYLYVIR